MGNARHLSYFSDYKNEPLVCPLCGWQGTWAEGDHEFFESLVDCSCPACPSAPMLAIVASPTHDEWEDHRARLSPAEQAFGDAQITFQKNFAAKSLKDSSQLPDLKEEALNLEWDQDGKETVLRNADIEIWREPALWDGYLRFLDVLVILKARYGLRLRDLKPTAASMDFLLGDNISASSILANARAGILANPVEQ